MKQAIKKGAGLKKASLSSFKEKHNLNYKSGETKTNFVSNADKPQSWIKMPKAFQECLKLPGIPENTVVSVIGHSNTGKSTLINHAIVEAQKMGRIPVIIDTENSFSFKYAIDMGFKAEPIYDDVTIEDINPETGEVTEHTERQIVYWEGDFIYYNNKILADEYGDMDYSKGVTVKTKRTTAVIEDVALCINNILDAQERGEIEQGLLFVWDSVGSIGSFKEYNSGKTANAMWSAAAISVSMNNIINERIPSSKKISSKYNNTLLYVNKVWMDSMTNPVGTPIMQTKGGKAMKYATRLEILMGGQLTSSIKRLKATSKGNNYSYGIETKIKVLKNHLDAPNNVVYEGSLVASDYGFIALDDLEDYKKKHIGDILKRINENMKDGEETKVEDIKFVEEEEIDMA